MISLNSQIHVLGKLSGRKVLMRPIPSSHLAGIYAFGMLSAEEGASLETCYDKIIIGAGIYGLYAAIYCGRRGQTVLVLERDPKPFMRATYINQARVHQGYHYPRSLSTAKKSAHYFTRFCDDYGFCLNDGFDQIYGTSQSFSWTDAQQFQAFCEAASIPCEEVSPGKYFKKGMCDGAFLTQEYTYDARILRDFMVSEIEGLRHVEVKCSSNVTAIERSSDRFRVILENGLAFQAPFLLNASYASTNQIQKLGEFDESFGLKYELCEIILCDTADAMRNCGVTVMDGPFFSLMPFGKTGLHSLTSVTFTPHKTSYDALPTFDCQDVVAREICSKMSLGNCNECPGKPKSAFPYMSNLAKKYLQDEYAFTYKKSLFSMKPILTQSEIDDSRPTVIARQSNSPTFVSVLSGKINTIYDLDEVL